MDWKLLRRAIVRQWIVVAAAALLGALVAFGMLHRARSYSAEASVVLADANAAPSQNATDAAHLSVQVTDLPALAQSTTVLARVAQDLRLPGAGEVRRHLNVRVSQGATIMPIVYTDLNPKVAVAGANAVADELTKFDRQVTTSRFDSLIADLGRQVETSRRQLVALDNRISQASIANPLVDSKLGTDALNARIIEVRSKRDDAIAQARGDQASAEILARLVRASRSIARKENGEADAVYQNLRSQYAKDAAELARVRATFSKSYPGLPELVAQNRREQRQIAAAEARIAASSPLTSKSYADAMREKLEADAKVAGDQAQIAALDAELAANTRSVATTSSANTSLSALRRERDVAGGAYTQLSDRLTRAMADRAQAASLGSIAVIDSAVSAEQGSSTTARIVGSICFLAALWIGIGVAVVLELMREEASTERLASELYGAPVFAVVRGE